MNDSGSLCVKLSITVFGLCSFGLVDEGKKRIPFQSLGDWGSWNGKDEHYQTLRSSIFLDSLSSYGIL
jgi:hypothetical protein